MMLVPFSLKGILSRRYLAISSSDFEKDRVIQSEALHESSRAVASPMVLLMSYMIRKKVTL